LSPLFQVVNISLTHLKIASWSNNVPYSGRAKTLV